MFLISRILRTKIRNVPNLLWNVLCIVIISTATVMLSRNTQHAFNLRTWRNETNDYIILLPTINTTDYQEYFGKDNSNLNPNTGNEISIPTNETDPKKCVPAPPMEDFTKCGGRVADIKCCEYIWAWKYKYDLLEHAKCGVVGIVGGYTTQPRDFPHMAALGYKRKNSTKNNYGYLCGGSLISERFVLTAAHCKSIGSSTEFDVEPSIVVMGSTDTSKNMTKYSIENIISHENYHSPKHYYDIALLKLRQKVIFTYEIHPACLSTELNPKYTKVNITGWGATKLKGSTSNELLFGTVNIVNNKKCHESIHWNRNFKGMQRHQLCAGDLKGRVDTCQGDSGGPVQVRLNTAYGNIHLILGITSFGYGCAASETPSVYTSVFRLVTWIEKKVWPEYDKDYFEGLGY